MRTATHTGRRTIASGFAMTAFVWAAACAQEEAGTTSAPDSPEMAEARQVLSATIERHGGGALDRRTITFGFREDAFRLVRENGLFYQERIRETAAGVETDVMTNEGTYRWVDGAPLPLSPEELHSLETGVNSIVYFAFLPFRLDDPAVRPRDLGSRTIEGRPYRLIEVTFDEEGGGRDYHDRFLYWIHEQDNTLDYLAYLYHVNDGGIRFRRAIQRREVDGLLVQDYENFRLVGYPDDVASYEAMTAYEGELDGLGLEWVSDVILDDVRTGPLPEPRPWAEIAEGRMPAPPDGRLVQD
jgi:hypothetical protein